MAGRERPRRADPDDWFAGDERRTRIDWDATGDGGSEPVEWYDAPTDREPRSGPSVRLGTLLAGGAVLLVVVVLVVLAASGVFSGGGGSSATTTSTGEGTTTAQTPTTPTTTPTKPATRTPAPTTTLKPGDSGAQVKVLQRALAKLGYSVGKADGDYGPSTQAAVERFQKKASLTADGVVGAKTLAALKQALAASG